MLYCVSQPTYHPLYDMILSPVCLDTPHLIIHMPLHLIFLSSCVLVCALVYLLVCVLMWRPVGDSLTRKSLFDSLVAGCIPVLFSRASLTQYKYVCLLCAVPYVCRDTVKPCHVVSYDIILFHIISCYAFYLSYLSLSPNFTISLPLFSPTLPPSLSHPPFHPPSLSPSSDPPSLLFFYPLTASRWHLSQSDVDDVAVYIPMSLINDDGGNFLTVLKAIPDDEVLRKQAAIRRIGR